jgi:hypothetical protein
MADKKRTVYHSILTKDGWAVKEEGKEPRSVHETQIISETTAVRLAKEIRDGGGLAQVIFHKENGEIREEHTYGADPERHPG